MDMSFFIGSILNLGINLLYTIIALMVGVVALKFVDNQLLKNVDIEKQLQNGNLAVSIFASTILLFVAVIVSFGLKG